MLSLSKFFLILFFLLILGQHFFLSSYFQNVLKNTAAYISLRLADVQNLGNILFLNYRHLVWK